MQYAHRRLTVVATVSDVRLVFDDRLVATHTRCWERERTFFEPIHYLALLERKPGGIDYARPLESWNLPECWALLRRRLEAHDPRHGTRSYIQVLRLLEKFLPQDQDGKAQLDQVQKRLRDAGYYTGDANGDVLFHARAKLRRKGCDLLVVNAVGDGRAFEVDNNAGWLLSADGTEAALELGSKTLMASRIVDAIASIVRGD